MGIESIGNSPNLNNFFRGLSNYINDFTRYVTDMSWVEWLVLVCIFVLGVYLYVLRANYKRDSDRFSKYKDRKRMF